MSVGVVRRDYDKLARIEPAFLQQAVRLPVIDREFLFLIVIRIVWLLDNMAGGAAVRHLSVAEGRYSSRDRARRDTRLSQSIDDAEKRTSFSGAPLGSRAARRHPS